MFAMATKLPIVNYFLATMRSCEFTSSTRKPGRTHIIRLRGVIFRTTTIVDYVLETMQSCEFTSSTRKPGRTHIIHLRGVIFRTTNIIEVNHRSANLSDSEATRHVNLKMGQN